jgi:hypothetical protein
VIAVSKYLVWPWKIFKIFPLLILVLKEKLELGDQGTTLLNEDQRVAHWNQENKRREEVVLVMNSNNGGAACLPPRRRWPPPSHNRLRVHCHAPVRVATASSCWLVQTLCQVTLSRARPTSSSSSLLARRPRCLPPAQFASPARPYLNCPHA